MNNSRSFPERLYDISQREYEESLETLEQYRNKDYERTEQLARMGSSSSLHPVVNRHDWRTRFCHSLSNLIDFFLEHEEEAKRQDEIIQQKSYAGFYYFVKWLTRSLFYLVFTILSSIAGKEIGCLIKDGEKCDSSAVELVDNSPHLIASAIGFIFGLVIGQWFGRIVWDHTTNCTQHCLRCLEKHADKTKGFLILLSLVLYVFIIATFATVFLFFVDINQDDENLIGAAVGGTIGLFCACIAYKKNSSCRSGQQTPAVRNMGFVQEPNEIVI